MENTLQVNKFARRVRHFKIFSKVELAKIYTFDFLGFTISPFTRVARVPFVVKTVAVFSSIKQRIIDVIPVAPTKKLIFDAVVLSVMTVFVTSLNFGGSISAASIDYSSDSVGSYAVPGDVLVADEEGYLVKMNPQTDNATRIGMTDYAVHIVSSGETLSMIAAKYRVGTDTIMWENNLANVNSLRIGQKLLIPPVDGISYQVNKGDSLEKVAKKYNIASSAIIAQNNLLDKTLTKGQIVFLPGAKPIASDKAESSSFRVVSATRGVDRTTTAAKSSASPAVGKIFIFPTHGVITQGFSSRHYGIDIADSSKPAIWAAASGKVIKVSVGTWGGGYGTHVIIDNGSGIQTLYGHMSKVNVTEGQFVNQGDVIGIMGNTGRVYGVTGIHLHWEVMINGVKRDPRNYY
ncbi:M23 family metallopeptidase [Candidatus Peregrinibacteria bacterium]|nr:M23 family metallopeptidase [Candidatus Peregrinibacteria bacterium]